jgi:hypothetical protein
MPTLDATALLSTLLLSASLVLTGCGSRASAQCNAAIECEGGNDADIDACIAVTEGAENAAAAYDCSDAFDKLMECVEKTGVCQKGDYETECGDQAQSLNKCEEAASARN